MLTAAIAAAVAMFPAPRAVAADGSGTLAARTAGGDVAVSSDAGATWRVVHRCGDAAWLVADGDADGDVEVAGDDPRDGALHCGGAEVLTWHAGTLYFTCGGRGLLAWRPAWQHARPVHDDAPVLGCGDARAAPVPPEDVVAAVAAASVAAGDRPRPAAPAARLAPLERRARRRRWVPRVSLGVSRGLRGDGERATTNAFADRYAGATEFWLRASWSLDRPPLALERTLP